MRINARIIAFSCALFFMSGCMLSGGKSSGTPQPPFERVADGVRVDFAEMVRDLKKARIVFIGELHDNREHHRLQLEIVKALQKSGEKLTIALEMFRIESQPALDLWTAGKLDLFDFMQIYRENWSIPWEIYNDIFLYARNNEIPLLGLNAPNSVMQKVYRQGFAALSPEELKMLPPNTTCRVDKPYMRQVRRSYVWHSDDEAGFIRFCEAQLLRNKVMANNLVNSSIKEPGRMIVVLTGVGHAMRNGVPDEVSQLSKLPVRIVIPRLHEIAAEPLEKRDADYLMH